MQVLGARFPELKPALKVASTVAKADKIAENTSTVLHKQAFFSAYHAGLKKVAEYIQGGLSSGKKPSDFPKAQLKMGIKVEHEHTPHQGIAQEIAMDHLAEHPDYYTRLKKAGL